MSRAILGTIALVAIATPASADTDYVIEQLKSIGAQTCDHEVHAQTRKMCTERVLEAYTELGKEAKGGDPEHLVQANRFCNDTERGQPSWTQAALWRAACVGAYYQGLSK